MRELQLMKVAADCLDRLAMDGLSVRQAPINSDSVSRMHAIGREAITAAMSPQWHDFTDANGFWMFLRRDGEDIAGAGARLDDLGSEGLDSYWPRIYSRHFPTSDGSPPVSSPIHQDVADVKGRVIYLGDLFVSPNHRGSRETLACFVKLLKICCALRWEFDWMYSFLRRRDMERGAGFLYGFTRQIPGAMHWDVPDEIRGNHECLALSSRAEFQHLIKFECQSISRE